MPDRSQPRPPSQGKSRGPDSINPDLIKAPSDNPPHTSHARHLMEAAVNGEDTLALKVEKLRDHLGDHIELFSDLYDKFTAGTEQMSSDHAAILNEVVNLDNKRAADYSALKATLATITSVVMSVKSHQEQADIRANTRHEELIGYINRALLAPEITRLQAELADANHRLSTPGRTTTEIVKVERKIGPRDWLLAGALFVGASIPGLVFAGWYFLSHAPR